MATTRLTSQERRAAILDAAVRLFSEKGFRGVTTRELAAAVGVSEPVLYAHFETKRDLYRAIIEERGLMSGCEVPTEISRVAATATDDREFLRRLAAGIIKWHTDDPTYVRLLMFSALEQHELSQMFFDRYSGHFFEEIARFFERRITEGKYRPVDPMAAAQIFVSSAAQYGTTRAIFHHGCMGLEETQFVDGMVDIFLEGMKAR